MPYAPIKKPSRKPRRENFSSISVFYQVLIAFIIVGGFLGIIHSVKNGNDASPFGGLLNAFTE